MGLRESIEKSIRLERFEGEELTQDTLKIMGEYVNKQLCAAFPLELNKLMYVNIIPDPDDPTLFHIDFCIKYKLERKGRIE